MPKITIYEEDYTSIASASPINYNVLMPGLVYSSKGVGGEGCSAFEIKEWDDQEDFLEAIIGTSTKTLSDFGIGARMAYELIGLGLTVLYAPIEREVEYGTEKPDVVDYNNFWKKFEDKSTYQIRYMCCGIDALAEEETYDLFDAIENVIKAAAARGDAIALVSADETTEKTVATLDSWVKTKIFTDLTANKDILKYGSLFAPHFTVTYSPEDSVKYPGYFGYLSAFASHKNEYADWYAFAGSVRGVLPYSVGLNCNYGDADIDVLQNRSTENHISTNVISPIRPYGKIVWGNRTMYPNQKNGSNVDLKASSFLNIRMLCSDIKNTLYEASRKYTFEPNSDMLWTKFTSEITPLLDEMKSNQGIKGYKITKIKSSKKATLEASIRIVPIEAVEDFILTIYLQDSIEVSED